MKSLVCRREAIFPSSLEMSPHCQSKCLVFQSSNVLRKIISLGIFNPGVFHEARLQEKKNQVFQFEFLQVELGLRKLIFLSLSPSRVFTLHHNG